MKNKKNLFWSAFSTNLIAKIIQNIFPLLISIIIIRKLSIEDFGSFSLFLSFLSLFGGLSFGIQHVYQRYVAIYAENNNDINRVVKLTLVTAFARTVIFLSLVGILYCLTSLEIININALKFHYIWLSIITCIFVISKFVVREGLLCGYIDHKYFNLIDNAILSLKCIIILIILPVEILSYIYMADS